MVPWRTTGTQRSWGGKRELPKLQSRLTTANESDFEKLSLALLRLALAPPDRFLDEDSLQAAGGGYVAKAGAAALPVFVQLVAFQEPSEDLGEAHVLRCREAMERFAQGPLQTTVYLLIHNRDPRSPAFRTGLEREVATLRESGRVIAAVVCQRSELQTSELLHAEEEWEDLQALAGEGRRIERIPARLRELDEAFRSGTYDGWHFTGHGRYRKVCRPVPVTVGATPS